MSTWGTVVVVVIAVIGVAAVAAATVTARRRVAAERLAAADARQRAAAAADELARERAEMAAGLDAAHAERDAAETARRQAAEAAEAARLDAEAAQHDVAVAVAAQQAAVAAAAAAELRAADLAGALCDATRPGVDAGLLWDLERARSERTWRHSVALDPQDPSVFVDASDPLRVALQVELEAAREEVGAVVVLDVEIPLGMRASGSLLTLRVAQELLAEAMRRGEETTLHVRPDGTDLLVSVTTVDADGTPVELPPLDANPSAEAVLEGAGVRIIGAVDATTPTA
jgi:hypothetical protein